MVQSVRKSRVISKKEAASTSPFIAKSFPVFFSRTRYTFPTSPRPSILIFWKLDAFTSTDRTLIEWLEYVLLKAARPGDSCPKLAPVIRSLLFAGVRTIPAPVVFARVGFGLVPPIVPFCAGTRWFDEPEEDVSNDVCS